jgi:acetoin utilization protein AcuC
VVADGRWIVTGGGGYSVVSVVPRAWTHLLAIVAGTPLDPATSTPPGWREYVETRLGVRAPLKMTDGRDPAYRDWSEGFDPNSWLDRAINATRSEVFPWHGLDPLPY